jgi:hypothetical protein
MIATTRWLRAAVLPAVLVGATACDPEAVTASAGMCGRNAAVAVSVTGGAQGPSFSWSPGCRAALVLVEDPDGEDLWELSGNAGVAPGVRYGIAPEGTSADGDASPLVRGSQYVVSVYGGPPGSGDEYLLGSATFVAP